MRHRDDPDPAEREAHDGGEPLGRSGPAELGEDRSPGPDPDHSEHDVLEAAVQREQTDRRVGPRDQQVDAGVVEFPHPHAGTWAPPDTVVERARAEHGHCRRREDRGRDEPPSVDRAYEYRADDAGDEEAGLMEHPAQQRRPRERQLRHRG